MAPVLQELERQNLPHLFVLTGQHTETMDDLIKAFKIRHPDDILVQRGEANTKIKLIRWLQLAWQASSRKPYFKHASSILVHGDTISTLLGALIGKRNHIPIVHIEAGLRSFNYFHPFPEEIIRLLVDKMSSIHFCQDNWAVNNLSKYKNNRNHHIINTKFNTIVDSLRFALQNNVTKSRTNRFSIVSLHRYENLSNTKRFNTLMQLVIDTSLLIHVKFIMHPVTKLKLIETGWLNRLKEHNISLLERMDYVSFIQLITASNFLITDGGSNQEETAYMGLPCLIMRKATERQEGIGENTILSHYDSNIIFDFINKHCNTRWLPKKLPSISPSTDIVFKLQQLTHESTDNHLCQ